MTDSAEKTRENRARRAAKRQGYLLYKSARRDPLALEYGRWALIYASAGDRYGGRQAGSVQSEFANGGLSLDQVEQQLQIGAQQ